MYFLRGNVGFLKISGKLAEEEGIVKKKRHSPHPDSLDFDKDGLLAEVQGYPERYKVQVWLSFLFPMP